jgi:hypothetical protein
MIPVEETLARLLAREDTNKNMQITIDDLGPKVAIAEPFLFVFVANKTSGLVNWHRRLQRLQSL